MINSAPQVKELLSSDNRVAARDQARIILRPSNYPPQRIMWGPQWQRVTIQKLNGDLTVELPQQSLMEEENNGFGHLSSLCFDIVTQ